jgi:hypothetical protein
MGLAHHQGGLTGKQEFDWRPSQNWVRASQNMGSVSATRSILVELRSSCSRPIGLALTQLDW